MKETEIFSFEITRGGEGKQPRDFCQNPIYCLWSMLQSGRGTYGQFLGSEVLTWQVQRKKYKYKAKENESSE